MTVEENKSTFGNIAAMKGKSEDYFECDASISQNGEINNPPDSPTATVK